MKFPERIPNKRKDGCSYVCVWGGCFLLQSWCLRASLRYSLEEDLPAGEHLRSMLRRVTTSTHCSPGKLHCRLCSRPLSQLWSKELQDIHSRYRPRGKAIPRPPRKKGKGWVGGPAPVEKSPLNPSVNHQASLSQTVLELSPSFSVLGTPQYQPLLLP